MTVLRYLRQYGFTSRSTPKNIRLESQVFGGLTVLSRVAKRNPYEATRWICQCTCGSQASVQQKRLVSGAQRSCGCLAKGTNSKNYKGTPHISKSYWNAILRSARDRHVPLFITIEDAETQFVQQNGKCALTGMPIKPCVTRHSSGDWTASLDRIDSDKGYTKDNIQWVHKDVNRMKWHFSQDHFVSLCIAVFKHHVKTKRIQEVA